MEPVQAVDTYHTFVDAVRGAAKETICPFSLAGPITEAVLTGCLAEQLLTQELIWDSKGLTFPNNQAASKLVKKEYRKGWEVAGM